MREQGRGWLRRLHRRPDTAADDAADYGTCFGLDLSLAPAAPVEPPAAAEPARPGWMARWKERRRAAA